MADYATKIEVQEIVNKAVDDLSEIIQSFAHNVDVRFNKVEADIAELNKKYDHLITTLDTFLKRLDNIEIDNRARDAQLARLERWIEQVAAKTGIKLEY
jgi:septal ring factor EnvC (AmiA/AmiB activator)